MVPIISDTLSEEFDKKYSLPEPVKITPEIIASIRKEADEWSKHYREKVKSMRLTAEDWRTIVR